MLDELVPTVASELKLIEARFIQPENALTIAEGDVIDVKEEQFTPVMVVQFWNADDKTLDAKSLASAGSEKVILGQDPLKNVWRFRETIQRTFTRIPKVRWEEDGIEGNSYTINTPKHWSIFGELVPTNKPIGRMAMGRLKETLQNTSWESHIYNHHPVHAQIFVSQ